jgi:hypothetical protein
MKNDIMEEMLGYKPDKETRLLILKTVKESGKSMQEIIGAGRTVPIMPEMAILGADGRFEYRSRRITASEWERVNPLGSFGKIVVTGTKAQIELHRKLCNNDTK